jgi:hypothetical protein
MEPTEYSEMSAFNIQTPGKNPEENIPYLKHGESLKPTTFECFVFYTTSLICHADETKDF